MNDINMKNIKQDRINQICNHDLYKENLIKNDKAETEREFCRHDMGHFLDVARIAQILNMKEAQYVEEDLIYAAALLHDIGRHIQYESDTPHELASAKLAAPILTDCGFTDSESEVIVKAICNHRAIGSEAKKGLTGLLYRADKLSRSCFACKAEDKCNWKKDKKNMSLVWKFN